MKDISQCEFGCGVRVSFEKVEFNSDGLKIHIPREVDDSVHNCPNLPDSFDPDQVPPQELMPEDGDEWVDSTDKTPGQEFMEDWGSYWFGEDVKNHFEDLGEGLTAIDGLEFKNIRQGVKEFLVQQLETVSHFYHIIHLSSAEEDLPACLQTDAKHAGQFYPVELLGLFYQMDGSLDDAKKCFKIQKEIGWLETIVGKVSQSPSQRIEEIDEEIQEMHMFSKEKQKVDIPIIDVPKLVQQQGSFVELDNQKLRVEIDQFEKENLHNFILYMFPGKKLIEKLKNTKDFPKKTTLYEKYEERLKTEKEKSVLEKQGTPLSYLDFGDKNMIVREIIKRSYWYMLANIKTRRNDLGHSDDTPKELKKARQDDEITLNGKTRHEIKLVKNYFERLKDA